MYLQQIIEARKRRLKEEIKLIPLEELRQKVVVVPPPLDFADALKGNGVSLIAEVKKASPSRGIIRKDFKPLELALTYAATDVAAISVLTEQDYFKGKLDDLVEIKRELPPTIPVLRKDFIISTYQVYQSRAAGADALLLIAAILNPQQLSELLEVSRQLHMDCLVEIHDENELAIALDCDAGIIGINNRDLTSFKVDLNITTRLRPLIPTNLTTVSESGIKSRADIKILKELEIDAALVGEALLTTPNIAQKVKELF